MRRTVTLVATVIISSFTLALVQPASEADTTSNTDIHLPHAFELPCSVVLNPVRGTPNARGAAVFFDVREKYAGTSERYWQKTAFSVVGYQLPAPSSFSDYDAYEGFAQVPGVISWSFRLTPSVSYPPYTKVQQTQIPPTEYTWAGTFLGITASLTKDTKVQIRLINSKTNKLGLAVLEGTVKFCR